jgi:hypothetical protein
MVMTEVFALRTNLWTIADPRLRLAASISRSTPAPMTRSRRCSAPPASTADGHFGPMSQAAVNGADANACSANRVMDERYQKAAKVVLKNRDQLANLLGWTVRFGKILRWRPEASAS